MAGSSVNIIKVYLTHTYTPLIEIPMNYEKTSFHFTIEEAQLILRDMLEHDTGVYLSEFHQQRVSHKTRRGFIWLEKGEFARAFRQAVWNRAKILKGII